MFSFITVACSSGSGTGNANAQPSYGATLLSIATLAIIQSDKLSNIGYAVASNNTSETIESISFNITDQIGSDTSVKLNNNSCKQLEADKDCILTFLLMGQIKLPDHSV